MDNPLAYVDEFGSVAKVHSVVDKWSSNMAKFAQWADERLDSTGSCYVPYEPHLGRGDGSLRSQHKANMGLFAGVVAKHAVKAVSGLRSASQEHLDWREHVMYGFMVREERLKWAGGRIPAGKFEEICRAEIEALKRMG